MAFSWRSLLQFGEQVGTQLHQRIGLDIGTAMVRVWSDERGMIINEPNCLAVDQRTQRVIAVGKEAAEMQGRVGAGIRVRSPWAHGMIADQALADAEFRFLLRRVFRSSLFFRPVTLVSVPSSIGDPEQKALVQLLFDTGMREVNFIDQVVAAAIGSGVPIADASGTVIVHLGAGVVEVGIVSLGSVIAHRSLPLAGQYLEELLRFGMEEQLQLRVGIQALEQCLHTGLDLLPTRSHTIRIAGQKVGAQVPQEVVVESQHLVPMIRPWLRQVLGLIQDVLAEVPPELANDVIDKGIIVTGGLANIPGWAEFLTENLHVPVTVADNPELAVMRGITQTLQHLELFQQSLGYRYETQYSA